VTNNCPTCGAVIDPLRAPVARIVEGRVRTYCSRSCADGAAAVAKVTAAAADASEAIQRRSGPIAMPGAAAAPSVVDEHDQEHDEHPRSATEHRRRRNRRVMWLSAGIVTGGMAVAVIQTVSPSSPHQVAAEDGAPATSHTDAGATSTGDQAPVFNPKDPVQVRDRAVAELRELLPAPVEKDAKGAHVTRVAKEAARALARTRDQAALDVLARALADEPAGFGRVELAYALARGGDARGTKDLVAALKASGRDVRADAARALALLGDPRAVPVLQQMLGVSQLEVGAAVALAPLRDKKALELLDEVRKDEKRSREDRWRALVALGVAGRADVAADLRAVLDQREYNVGAAEALARLGDAAAKPVLVADLSSPSLQVGAALGLRRLEPGLDPSPYLPALVTTLDSGKDTARVSAAEAILVLTGPPEIAERD
jgi:HEAT repeat protein